MSSNPWGLSGVYTAEAAAAAIAAARRNPMIKQGSKAGAHFNMQQVWWGSGQWDQAIPASGFAMGDTPIPEQMQKPENPGIRKTAVSTYGVPIPISGGMRAIVGNIIWADNATPRIIGTYDYYVKIELNLIPAACCDGPDTQQCSELSDCSKQDGTCTDIYREMKSCFNYTTGKYAIFDCVAQPGGTGYRCTVSDSNTATGFGLAFETQNDDGGVAQCAYCESIGVYDSSQECIAGIPDLECTNEPG